MGNGGGREVPERRDVRVAALEGVIAALEAQLAEAEGEERRAIAAELAARERELERIDG